MMKEKMYATSESNFIYEIDPITLDTLKRVDIADLPGIDYLRFAISDFLLKALAKPLVLSCYSLL